jgi:hypothetical protein
LLRSHRAQFESLWTIVGRESVLGRRKPTILPVPTDLPVPTEGRA